ncbi:cell wall metabolism sensor histidine kinase WalK [Streptomyces sp. GESEQ-4]|uniref:sensor histidine kinase n=1 Tax=Streptomyces sp. GESEQ-4 TaxID=2812655 RepID=UPI001B329A7C|nr:ATP-binding protein [Streptomyces sp. GESEQ-4]
MATLLYRLGAWGARRWRRMLIGWLLALGAVVGLGFSFAGSFTDSSSIPGSPAQTALTKMERHFPEPDVQSAQVVFQAPAGRKVTEADLRTPLEAMGRVPGVSEVSDPSESGTVSEDGRTAVAEVTFRRQLALIGGTLLVLLGLSVIVLRLGMRPLARMARSADAIAAGSLTERLPTHRNGSEADLLAKAVNRAFDAQARAEATVRSLAADTSHELRTPLSTISGWLDLHRQGGLSGPGLETALEHIENEVGRMRLLVEELSLLARLDAGRPVEQDDVDLTVLAAGVIEDAQIIYPQRDIAMAPALPAPVIGDAARLQQVLRNLVGNAVQHTPAQTSVRVEVTLSRGTVELSVIDNGPGISPEDLPRVFERFWRAEASRSRAYGGSGLGLAIVEAIVHAHHGQVAVYSDVGVGTTVTIRLPRGHRP